MWKTDLILYSVMNYNSEFVQLQRQNYTHIPAITAMYTEYTHTIHM
jgi:hypothetical protein